MKLRQAMISLAMVLAAGCDTMEQDADLDMLVNTQPAYFLSDGTGYIDLPARIKAPGKTRVEISSTTQNGKLTDLGKGLLQYTPAKGSTSDSFRFTAYLEDGSLLSDNNKIDIIMSNDTTNLPCVYVYTRNDEVHNVTGPVVVDVAANDYACDSLTVSVNVAPEHGTATVLGNRIHYVPGASFTGVDQLLYKATSADPSVIPGYGMLRIFGQGNGPDSTCHSIARNDLFFKALNDTNPMDLTILANDSICYDSLGIDASSVRGPRFGTVSFYTTNPLSVLKYEPNSPDLNLDDTLYYRLEGGNNTARVIIKRQ